MMGFDADIAPEKIQVLHTLGNGSYGSVYLVEYNGAEAAAKVVHVRGETRKMIEREVAIISRVQHPNLVSCLGICQKEGFCFILQEFCAGGAIFELLHNCDHIDISWQQQCLWLKDCASGMKFLHDNGIIHRDLKSLNCLLASPVHAATDLVPLKVADFGLGKVKEDCEAGWGKMTIAAGTCHWMAPEVFTGSTYAEPVDVYSYSMFMFEVICREIPFEEYEPAQVGQLSVSGGRPDMEAVPPDCPPSLSALMVACWSSEPKSRPTFCEICEQLDGMVGCVSGSMVMNPSQGFASVPAAVQPSLGQADSSTLPRPTLPEDVLPTPEPDPELQEHISDALRLEVRCERSQVSTKRRELLGMVTVLCPERHIAFCPESRTVAPAQPSDEPEPSPEAKHGFGLDLILVLDVSASMRGEKIQMLKQAAHFIIKELGTKDRLAIISFSTTAHEHLNFCRMNKEGKARAEKILDALEVGSQTSIAAGLKLGVGLADARQSRNLVSGLLLLTDGQNNFGSIPATLVSDARNRGLSIYAFGIGADHDAALLGQIAEQAKTPVAYIENPGSLAGSFAATVSGLLSVRARNVEVQIHCLGRTELKAVHSPFVEQSTCVDAKLVLPDLFAGERRDILLDLDAPSGNELLEISVQFRDEHGLASIPSRRLQISRGEPETEPDDEVTTQRERFAVADILKQALQEGRARHVIKARKLLEDALQRPWRPEHRSELEDSLKRLSTDIGGAKPAGFASLADVAQMHCYQRCLFSSPGLGGSNGSYLTSGQLQAIARSA